MPLAKKYQSARNDFRSDTFTTPSPQLLEKALSASIGDSVFGEDSDTVDLEERIASLTGKEAGLYCVSGTLSNQIAVRTHLHQPPYSILCDYRSHIYVHEAAGLATLSNAMVTPVRPSNGDYMTLEDIKKHIIPEDGDIHGAPTQLISLENTLHGIVYPIEELKRISKFCKENDYPLHCDGARIWNASVASGVSLKEYGEIFDTISLCLSKSLGAPIGSVLVGPKKFIKKANHFKKQNGGGIRQSGLLTRIASAAIDENLPKLQESHNKARDLADFLIENGIELESPVDTNFVFIDLETSPIDDEILEQMAEKYGLKLWNGRITFHYQIDDESLKNVKKAILEAFQLSKKVSSGEANHKFYKYNPDDN
ncbi:Threonine aldolase [Wickerhamomyces ciferrii]|uniref:low-specificity L-threonine aldolase n=1 Tax=Wickerhamomyces ciferrii (strain ATCC 14091 / BCRC 22168 / CBS 111 / JCM 3599 / NBRC 0793 / NRRL Y-1031 F-60-10) TaxID=1206466 RepID=K0KND3_WICCF|nr:Threonine aldolase [Wickerhamomyces ciferrii]CCH42633.1 Threonine aldolase [Wickerhamomyces ciferrii]